MNAMARQKKTTERGGSKANLILTLFVLGIMGFVAIKICPVYFANYEFQDSIESESRFALTGYPKKTPLKSRWTVEAWRSVSNIPCRSTWRSISSRCNFTPTRTTIPFRIEVLIRVGFPEAFPGSVARTQRGL